VAGKGQMPPQSGGDFSDYEIARAVVFMTNKAGASFAEPAPPAATPPATTTSAADAGSPGVASTAGATGAAPNAGKPEATAQAALSNAAAAATAAPAAATAAPALYEQTCSTCHTPGIAGAPKVGDKAGWAQRVAQGIDALTASAIKGKGAMPPKGGSSASDADIKAVVTYMVNASK